jgi:hypothetical protein
VVEYMLDQWLRLWDLVFRYAIGAAAFIVAWALRLATT